MNAASDIRAWSAGIPSSASVYQPADHRQVKSATTLPTTNVFDEEMERAVAAGKMPGVGHRGRSIKVKKGWSPVDRPTQTQAHIPQQLYQDLGLTNLSSPMSPDSLPRTPAWAYNHALAASESNNDNNSNATTSLQPWEAKALPNLVTAVEPEEATPWSAVSSETDWIPTQFPKFDKPKPKEGGPLRFRLAELPKRADTAREKKSPAGTMPHRRAWSAGNSFWPSKNARSGAERSRSESRSRSPKRTAMKPEREPIIPPWDIPFMISEVEEAPTPPRKTKTEPMHVTRVEQPKSTHSARSSLSFTPSENTVAGVKTRPSTAVRAPKILAIHPNVNKGLPALPDFLVPTPLFSPRDGPGMSSNVLETPPRVRNETRTASITDSELMDAFPTFDEALMDPNNSPKDFFLDWNFQQSRFSAWSIEEDIITDYAEFSSDTEGGHDEEGYEYDDDDVFSSVPTSGETSPMYLAEATQVTFRSLNWLGGSNNGSSNSSLKAKSIDVGGERTDAQPDAFAKEDDGQVSTLEEMIDELNYLGPAVQ
jgi:hypothetical protein